MGIRTFDDRLHDEEIREACNSLTLASHGESLRAGWWNGPATFEVTVVPAKLCLIHSEISEAMEGHRKDAMDDKLPHRKAIEVELADAVIRIFDLAGFLGLDIGGAMIEKMAYNRSRADHKTEVRAQSGGKRY
jgi:NTP pyrophosphatase (non-canonical NTP hydrolase)